MCVIQVSSLLNWRTNSLFIVNQLFLPKFQAWRSETRQATLIINATLCICNISLHAPRNLQKLDWGDFAGQYKRCIHVQTSHDAVESLVQSLSLNSPTKQPLGGHKHSAVWGALMWWEWYILSPQLSKISKFRDCSHIYYPRYLKLLVLQYQCLRYKAQKGSEVYAHWYHVDHYNST